MRSLALVALILFAGRAHAETPAQRARSILDAQVASLTDDAKPDMQKMFDEKSVVLGELGGDALENIGVDLEQTIAGGSPHSVIKKVKVTSFTGGGTDTAVWFTAELTITVRSQEPEMGPPSTDSHTMRLTELVVSEGATWKVVASVLDRPQSPAAYAKTVKPVDGSAEGGPLAALAASTTALKAALAADPAVIVMGTEKGERAVGPKAAGKLLDRWSKLKLELDTKVREVRTKTWGYLQSNVVMVKGKQRFPMMVLVIAFPKTDGTWSVAAAHYSAN